MLKIPKCDDEATEVILTGDPGFVVDLYDKPIDLRPVPPKEQTPDEIHHDAIHQVLLMLRENGDHFGARLIIENAHLLRRS
jgi:hypothetical protein